ncbi:hypothetical protein L3Q82_013764, partial [Scortum barcoo]
NLSHQSPTEPAATLTCVSPVGGAGVRSVCCHGSSVCGRGSSPEPAVTVTVAMALRLRLRLWRAVSTGFHLHQAIAVETLVTLQLILVVLATADVALPAVVSSLLVGLAVSLGHLVAVSATGCGMNPARSFGPAVVMLDFNNHWVFWVGPGVGACLAVLVNDLLLRPRWRRPGDWWVELRELYLLKDKQQQVALSFVVIGAPKANTSQSGVTEGGGVFLCPASPEGGNCDIINFDPEGEFVFTPPLSDDDDDGLNFLSDCVTPVAGNEVVSTAGLRFDSFKSQQWFGATVRSVSNTHLLACAPLFHWNVQSGGAESGKTPVGNCILLDQGTGSSTPFSPCRGTMMEEDYRRMGNRNDQRYCEVGFSADITKVRRQGRKDHWLVLGALQEVFIFRVSGDTCWSLMILSFAQSLVCVCQVITVAMSDIINSGQSSSPIHYLTGISQSDERGGYDLYRGYSVTSGQLTGDSTPDYVVGAPNDRNTAGTVKIYDGRSTGVLRVYQTFHGAQVASYFGHSVAVTDVNSDGLDDVLVGAPLFMDRVTEQLQERGQVVLYLQRRHTYFSSQPDQSLIGSSLYGRFGSALAVLGDLDMDGYHDVAVGAPWSGDSGQGQVFIYQGNSNGLSALPSQVIDSPLPHSRTAFGFTLRGGADVDGNGYPDLLVGAWAADRAFVYQSRAVIRSRVSVSLLPDFLNPDVKLCQHGNTNVSCFDIQVCVYVSGHRIPQETALEVELQLDRMKQPMARRTLLLSTNQPQHTMKLMVQRTVGVVCVNQTAYLRTRIILDCGDDNICVPDLKLHAEPCRQVSFSVSGRLEEVESHITFNLRIRSKNLVNPNSNEVTVQVQVKAEATLEIRGGSSPSEVVLPLPDWQPEMHPGSLEERGSTGGARLREDQSKTSKTQDLRIRVQFTIEGQVELRNQGPSAINARLTVAFPSTWRHHFLLYVFSDASEESLSCQTLNASQIDPFKLVGNSSSVSVVSQMIQQEETNSHSHTVHVVNKQNCIITTVITTTTNCSSSEIGCVRSVVCDVMALGRGFSAVVRISARLWTHTHAQTQLSVSWRPPDGEKNVPIGYIVLSIISGLLLLGLLCFIFWKLGFFKRTRPPTDEDDEDDDEEQCLAESHD